MRAVRLTGYGGVEVLELAEVPAPEPGRGQVLVRMRAAGLNLGESKIRSGALKDRFPTEFPSGEGSDLAGTVASVGAGAGDFSVGDEVAGFTDDRASHAELVLVEAANLVHKPAGVPWAVAGSLYVAGTTAYAAVRAVAPRAGETVLVAGAGGGVGGIAAQLTLREGARVLGVAAPRDHDWLRELGVTPLAYGPQLGDELDTAAGRIDALIDTAGKGYVALGIERGIPPDRIDTVIDFPAVERFGVKADGNAAAGTAEVLALLLDLVAAGELDVPVSRTFPLEEVRDAYRYLEDKPERGKVVLTSEL